ncbi:MAG: PucR family transcriptional regulator ligand-binding domain-containing protein [Tetrasphaera sp.]
MSGPTTLTVGDLLAHTPLGLELVSEAPTTARVRGAHSIELEHPEAWLRPGSVMLTTGLRFVGMRPGNGGEADLVAGLVAADVAALLFGIGVHFDTVPRALVLAASQAGFPVLTIPPEVPFYRVEDYVNSAVLGGDPHAAQRLLWLQNDLLQTLAEPRPVAALVRRLAALVKGTAVAYEESGRQVAAVGAGPTRIIWSELRSRKVHRHRS